MSKLILIFEVEMTKEQEEQLNTIEREQLDRQFSFTQEKHLPVTHHSYDNIEREARGKERVVIYPIFKALKFSDLDDWEW